MTTLTTRSDPASYRKLMNSPHRPGSDGPTPAGDEQWLVGFRFRTATGTLKRHYYVVPWALDGEDATHLAAQRANSAGEQARRVFASVDERWIEVHRLRRSAMGDWRLAEGT
jgi:hypothetical protein